MLQVKWAQYLLTEAPAIYKAILTDQLRTFAPQFTLLFIPTLLL